MTGTRTQATCTGGNKTGYDGQWLSFGYTAVCSGCDQRHRCDSRTGLMKPHTAHNR